MGADSAVGAGDPNRTAMRPPAEEPSALRKSARLLADALSSQPAVVSVTVGAPACCRLQAAGFPTDWLHQSEGTTMPRRPAVVGKVFVRHHAHSS